MIPRFNNFEAKKSASGGREILPAGGYVCKILKGEVLSYDWGAKLILSFDITEGEFKDFFKTGSATDNNFSISGKKFR